jgi:hypothetical protein
MISNSQPCVSGGVLAIEPGPAAQAGATTRRARRPARGGPGTHDHRAAAEAEVEAEAAATAIAIARLRWRISRPGTLEHPAVMGELDKLEQQLIAQLDSQVGRRPGRHRSPVREDSGPG